MKCIFCGKSAGLFKKEHPECRAVAEQVKRYLRECIDSVYANRNCMNISEVIAETTSQYHIPQGMIDKLFIECWNAKVLAAFEDGMLEADELKILREMLTALDIDPQTVAASPQWKMLMAHGKSAVMGAIDSAVKSKDLSALGKKIAAIADAYGFNDQNIKSFALEAWRNILDKAFEDGVLSRDEERMLNESARVLGLAESDIRQYNTKIVKGAILREVLEGITPHRLTVTNHLPVMLQNQESVIWLSNGVAAYENKTSRHYVGGSTGFSVRVASGVYLRSGAFRGDPVETTETVSLGKGSLIITNKNVFWVSPQRSIKIPVKKIVAVMPCSDGLILQKDGVTAKPLILIPDDPWFICNLVSNLNLL